MSEAGYVYIVHGTGTNFIKVGKSTNLQQRLKQLQQTAPFPLQLLSAQLVWNADEEEQALLQQYAAYRTHGEWFALPLHLLQHWPLDAPVKSFFVRPVILRNPSKEHEAMLWLEGLLNNVELPTNHILIAAAAVGIPERTLWRARKKLDIATYKRGATWYWKKQTVRRSQPETSSDVTPSARSTRP